MKAMKVAVVVSFSLLVVFLLLNVAGADRFYKYVDKDGKLNITDSLESVPQEYRASVKVIEFRQTDFSVYACGKRKSTLYPF